MQHTPRKRFGQNFLVDQAVIETLISRIAPLPDQNIVEIGPGQGALTEPLLRQSCDMTVIELDRDLVAALQSLPQKVSNPDCTFKVISADALTVDYAKLAKEKADKFRIVGNLPYNISSPLLFYLLEYSEHITDVHFMLQKEVVELIAAKPGSKTYGRLSVMMQWLCTTSPLVSVPSTAFKPQPKVESGFIRLVPKGLPVDELKIAKTLKGLVTAAFSQRRKTLRNSLSKWIDSNTLEQLGIDPVRRAETVSVEEYCLLAQHVYKTSDSHSANI